jgi:hypothetical protein
MQSFIINIPDEKVDFFLELAEMLDFEVLEIEEDEFTVEDDTPAEEPQPKRPDTTFGKNAKKDKNNQEDSFSDDPFLDWDAERQNAKKNKY